MNLTTRRRLSQEQVEKSPTEGVGGPEASTGSRSQLRQVRLLRASRSRALLRLIFSFPFARVTTRLDAQAHRAPGPTGGASVVARTTRPAVSETFLACPPTVEGVLLLQRSLSRLA